MNDPALIRAIEVMLGNQVNILHALAVIVAVADKEMARLLGEAAQLTVLEQQQFIEEMRAAPLKQAWQS